MSNSFSLLSKPIQKAIFEAGWDSLSEIQEKSIPLILQTNRHVVLSAGTAAGKTEAAFLPVLSAVTNSSNESLSVLYVCPLKALINDQFSRIEDLCRFAEIEVHKWHGDVSSSKKQSFLKNPKGILQITPESLESLFVNRTRELSRIFNDLQFIIIDEVHAFFGNERGIHLRSLLDRVAKYSKRKPRIVALSATINDNGTIKKWVDFSEPDQVEIVQVDNLKKKLLYSICYNPDNPISLYEDMWKITSSRSSMIFCNDRGLSEITSLTLNDLSERRIGRENYLIHHSSLDKKEREETEFRIKNANAQPISIVCTSTLEMGIDIGKIDLVVQMQSPFSVSSLKQKIGRTGRRKGMPQMLQMYTTDPDDLLKGIAVSELLMKKWVEPPDSLYLPYDILFHQILSICTELSEISQIELFHLVKSIGMFHFIEIDSFSSLISHMIRESFLQKMQGSEHLILGISGEKIVRSRDFYSVFAVSEKYQVFFKEKQIGEIDKTPGIEKGLAFVLGGKPWVISSIDFSSLRLYVEPSLGGKKPFFLGKSSETHQKIGEEMVEVLSSANIPSYLDENGKNALLELRLPYQKMNCSSKNRLYFKNDNEIRIHLYAGTKIAQTFSLMLRAFRIQAKPLMNEHLLIENYDGDLDVLLEKILDSEWTEQAMLKHLQKGERFYTKFSPFLPKKLQEELEISSILAISETLSFLKEISFIEYVD